MYRIINEYPLMLVSSVVLGILLKVKDQNQLLLQEEMILLNLQILLYWHTILKQRNFH